MLYALAINIAVGAANEIAYESVLTRVNLPTTDYELDDPFDSLQTKYQQNKCYRRDIGMVVFTQISQ